MSIYNDYISLSHGKCVIAASDGSVLIPEALVSSIDFSQNHYGVKSIYIELKAMINSTKYILPSAGSLCYLINGENKFLCSSCEIHVNAPSSFGVYDYLELDIKLIINDYDPNKGLSAFASSIPPAIPKTIQKKELEYDIISRFDLLDI